jgi:ubiquinone/menaquinone biosynthesis C-methylase UbiE
LVYCVASLTRQDSGSAMMCALPRTLEPEVMDSEQEAIDYDAMDHAYVNARFCQDFLAIHTRPRRVLDVGTGTALIPIELCRRTTEVAVLGIDLASHMLARAVSNVGRAGLDGRVRVVRADAKSTGFGSGAFDAVISNSIVHHIPEPRDALREMWRLVSAGGVVFVRDLARPESLEQARCLADLHAPADPGSEACGMHARQRALFVASLHAALTVSEVRAMVEPLGIPGSAVAMTSDRHWTLAHVRP